MKKILFTMTIVLLFLFATGLSNAQISKSKAIQEWLAFRANPEANKGKVVTWKCVYRYSSRLSNVLFWFNVSYCYLENDYKRPVRVDGAWAGEFGDGRGSSDYFGKSSAAVWGKIDKVRKNDILLITGEFEGFVSEEGEVELRPIEIKKIGFVD